VGRAVIPQIASRDSAALVRGVAGERIDRYLARAAAFGFSGAVLVADSTGVILRQGYGIADKARSLSIRPDMLFDMGSIVKQFTAAAILLLESEGKLSTTDSLKKFFPNVPADKASITLHQLLTHTAGVTDNLSGDYDQVSRDSALKMIWNAPLRSQPGQAFNYSNAGFSLLALIIEHVTGQQYEQFMRVRIFSPAGMTETGYHLPGLDTSRVAHTYTPPMDHGDPATRLARANGPSWNLMGNGGMLTTVTDMYNYELALRRGSPVSRAIQAKQFAEQFRRSPTLAHGYDWWIEPADDGGVQYNRAGDAPSLGVSAEYRRYPKDSTTFILLANNRHHGTSTRRFVMSNMRRLYLGTTAFDPPAVRPAAATALSSVTGTYRVDSSSYITVAAHDGRLVLSAFGQTTANILIFNRDTTSLRNRARVNDRMVDVVKALAMQDSAAAASALGGPDRARRLLAAWRDAERQFGDFKCVRVLGTDRLDRGVLLTTVSLRFADSTKTVRSTWSAAGPTVNSDDAELVNNFGFAVDSPVEAGVWSPYWWLQGSDTLITYDLASNQTLRARVARDERGAVRDLIFEIPGTPVRATRVDGPAALPDAWCATVPNQPASELGATADSMLSRYAMYGMAAFLRAREDRSREGVTGIVHAVFVQGRLARPASASPDDEADRDRVSTAQFAPPESAPVGVRGPATRSSSTGGRCVEPGEPTRDSANPRDARPPLPVASVPMSREALAISCTTATACPASMHP
jgi:CubicO group peptidase (beta-lactamase class C family)